MESAQAGSVDYFRVLEEKRWQIVLDGERKLVLLGYCSATLVP